MRNLTTLILLISILGLHNKAVSQTISDTSLSFVMFSASYMVQFPGGDLADRYGVNSNVGGSFMIKTRKNWLFQVEGNYIFGGTLKNDAAAVFDSIKTSNGNIINSNGEYSTYLIFERGFYFGGRLGRIIPVFHSNPNSGLLTMVGGGFLQHKIRIDNDGNNTPQIIKDYKKGYDKLTNGFTLTEFIGYVHFGENKMFNAYIGLEFYQAFTQSRRDYDFNLKGKDETKRLDLLYSLKVGWIIPIYQRKPEKFYYN